jgi:protein SCO1/2
MHATVRFRRVTLAALFASAIGLCCVPALAHGSLAQEQQEQADASTAQDEHAHHHHNIPPYTRSTANYTVPDVTLVRSDGQRVQLSDELGDSRAVVLSFIYTSCTTVCPLTSATLSALQEKLGSARDTVHLVSISIDPEYDTPARLSEYAQRFGAGFGWQYYTGTLAASQRSQRAFDVYRGNKMDHAPVTLLRRQPGAQWVRIEGFATADQLMTELALPADAGVQEQTHAQR